MSGTEPGDEGAKLPVSNQPKPEFCTATDGAVAGVCELLALLFGLPFGDDLYHGVAITTWGSALQKSESCDSLGSPRR
jgi:hypothetical protein